MPWPCVQNSKYIYCKWTVIQSAKILLRHHKLIFNWLVYILIIFNNFLTLSMLAWISPLPINLKTWTKLEILSSDNLLLNVWTSEFLWRRNILLSFVGGVLHFMLLNDHKKSFWEIWALSLEGWSDICSFILKIEIKQIPSPTTK